MIRARGGERVKPVTAKDILYQLRCIAMADVTGVINVRDGTLEVTSTGKIPKRLRCAIASIEKGPGGFKVKFYDKLKALELLGKYMGLFDGSGDGGQGESPLLQAILQATGEVTADEIQEVHSQAAAGDDLVE